MDEELNNINVIIDMLESLDSSFDSAADDIKIELIELATRLKNIYEEEVD